MTARTPFEDTTVPVQRSQDAIRQALRTAGALGVEFQEEWGDPPVCRVRFLWPIEGGTSRVRIEVNPLPIARGASLEQRERQAWRGLVHYLEANLKAAQFGLLRFEDIFLSFVELSPIDTRRVGDVLVPRLRAAQELLPG